MDSETEDRVIAKAIAGDFAAFEALVVFYTPSLWRFTLRMLDNAEDANDAVQQTLLQMYRGLPALREHAYFRAWLFTIARNTCLAQLRQSHVAVAPHSGRRTSVIGECDLPDDEFANVPDPSPLPQEVLEKHETIVVLREAVAALPDKARQIVALRYSTDLSFAEIGEVVGMRESATKVMFHRAKTQLRIYLTSRL